jgi:hypothetical protein
MVFNDQTISRGLEQESFEAAVLEVANRTVETFKEVYPATSRNGRHFLVDGWMEVKDGAKCIAINPDTDLLYTGAGNCFRLSAVPLLSRREDLQLPDIDNWHRITLQVTIPQIVHSDNLTYLGYHFGSVDDGLVPISDTMHCILGYFPDGVDLPNGIHINLESAAALLDLSYKQFNIGMELPYLYIINPSYQDLHSLYGDDALRYPRINPTYTFLELAARNDEFTLEQKAKLGI